MAKLLLLIIVLAVLALALVAIVLVVSAPVDRALDKRRERKGIEAPQKVDGDDLWLYANGASREDIELARAQRRLLGGD